MAIKYLDINNKEIKAGDIIQYEDGTYDLVYNCIGEDDWESGLGVNATNIDYYRNVGGCEIKMYPLYSFSNSSLKVVGNIDEDISCVELLTKRQLDMSAIILDRNLEAEYARAKSSR